MAQYMDRYIPRRRFFAGAGAAALGATAVGVTAAAPAEAVAVLPGGGAAGGSGAHPNATTAGTTIASAPLAGYTYRHAEMFDFTPESPSALRAWGGSGVYTTGTTSALWASMEIPAGAKIRDIEWYTYNSASSPTSGLGRIWEAGTGGFYTPVVDVTIPVSSAVVATRGVVTSANYGPFPPGTKLALVFYNNDTTGKQQVNGVRVGFSEGAGAVGVLPVPVRAYDTRSSGGRFAGGELRAITLPASAVPVGTTSVQLKFTSANSTISGNLKAYPAGGSLPQMTVLNYQAGQQCGNTVMMNVPPSRQIAILASTATDVVVDIFGTVG
ncbi:hypothetical protein SAMN05892883_0501 [Jatrophihabitans sp. GAS493]|uniref:hypothetical protein n=1 Tax=Jatrophihabitans sp. GAS493 TaxID=1907575 RepID=UPI000BC0E5F1|nr:hypothetical protein [Jatrophihabitans sp. GAS493]SOD70864.1 hypothetical protein SAMN05892883_0501 [Jatrophihabitans sp. GAS493]